MFNEATAAFIWEHRHDDVRQLAFKTTTDKEVDLHVALEQIKGFQTAQKKLPEWASHKGMVYPPHLSMEQCSSEQTARYKQRLLQRVLTEDNGLSNLSFTDLTAGFGVDFYYIALLFKKAHYTEQQPLLCHIARQNFKTLGLNNAEVIEGNAIEDHTLWRDSDVCFIDPARRDGTGRKTIAIEDCEPDISALQDLLLEHSACCLVKLSPMLDIHATISRIRNIQEIHVVSVNGECKELLLLITKEKTSSVRLHCANLANKEEHFSFDLQEEAETQCSYTSTLGSFLYEPNASIMKSGGFCTLSSRYELKKLHVNSHLYTSDTLVTDFPGRSFRIKHACSFSKKELKAALQNITQANLTIRNFPCSVCDLRKRLKIRDGGETYLFATTLQNEQHVLIFCEKV